MSASIVQLDLQLSDSSRLSTASYCFIFLPCQVVYLFADVGTLRLYHSCIKASNVHTHTCIHKTDTHTPHAYMHKRHNPNTSVYVFHSCMVLGNPSVDLFHSCMVLGNPSVDLFHSCMVLGNQSVDLFHSCMVLGNPSVDVFHSCMVLGNPSLDVFHSCMVLCNPSVDYSIHVWSWATHQ